MFCQVLKICKVRCFTIFLCNLFQNLTVFLLIYFLMKLQFVLLQLVIVASHSFTYAYLRKVRLYLLCSHLSVSRRHQLVHLL